MQRRRDCYPHRPWCSSHTINIRNTYNPKCLTVLFSCLHCVCVCTCMHAHARVHTTTYAQPCPTISDPMDCSPPSSSCHGIFQARILEQVHSYYMGFSQPRDKPASPVSPALAGRFFTSAPPGKPQHFVSQTEVWVPFVQHSQLYFFSPPSSLHTAKTYRRCSIHIYNYFVWPLPWIPLVMCAHLLSKSLVLCKRPVLSLLFSFFFWPYCVQCSILIPSPGMNPCPLQWKQGVLITGSQGSP